MARRDTKGWRRSRTLSTVFFEAPAKGKTSSGRLRSHAVALSAVLSLVVVVLYLVLGESSAKSAAPSRTPAPPAGTSVSTTEEHPNFDFDAHAEQHDVPRREAGDDDNMSGSNDEAEDVDAELEEDVDDIEVEHQDERFEAERGVTLAAPGGQLAQPFLPFTCEPCSSISPFHPSPPTCAKYHSAAGSPPPSEKAAASRASALHPDVLDHSVLFAGTGAEVRRVLKRAMRSSLYGAKRAREGEEGNLRKYEGEEPFRILVLGGSVSNCRGVNPSTTCWHTHVLRWFQQNLPMEGDRELVPHQPSLLVSHHPSSIVAGRERVKRRRIPTAPGNADFASSGSPQPRSARAKRGMPARPREQKKKAKSKKLKAGAGDRRRRPLTKLINGSKSATGSAFFAYCFEEEMTLRRKNADWGLGPDLIILETGINDVWPGGERATRDYEKLLRTLRSLSSKPAIIALEAASLLLASTTPMSANAEYDHLPAAHFYDVPVLSVKQALFGSVPGLASSGSSPGSPGAPTLKVGDLFQPDLHHPNERGHELLADVLVSYLEQQACLAQSELLDVADARPRPSESGSNDGGGAHRVDAELDFPRRKAEAVRPLPVRSLFTPFAFDKKGRKREERWDLPSPRCLQIGNTKTTAEPIENRGWTKLAWARDKQYLIADKPGASVTFLVEVSKGGTVLVDWLHSRFYDLGDVSVYLDGDRSKGVQLAGYWNLGWSIGVPTEVFTGVAAGTHHVTFELLPGTASSHPARKTNFRLIGLITT